MWPKRKNIRLKNYDYRQNGAYFITISTYKRQKLFGPETESLLLEGYQLLENKYPYCHVKEKVTMADHIHFVINLDGEGSIENREPISDIMQWFKGITTINYIEKVKAGVLPAFYKKIWQKGFYEHVIRSEEELYQVQRYIQENPLKLQLLQEEWKKK